MVLAAASGFQWDASEMPESQLAANENEARETIYELDCSTNSKTSFHSSPLGKAFVPQHSDIAAIVSFVQPAFVAGSSVHATINPSTK